MKRVLAIVAIFSPFAALHATDTIQVSPMDRADKPRTTSREIPVLPDKSWKISAEDYANLREECGQTKNYGLATDYEPQERYAGYR